MVGSRPSEPRAYLAMAVCVSLFAVEPVVYAFADAASRPAGFAAWAAASAAATAWLLAGVGFGRVRFGLAFRVAVREFRVAAVGAIGFAYLVAFALAVPRIGPALALVVVSVVPVLVMPVAIHTFAALRPLRRDRFSPFRFAVAGAMAAAGVVACVAGRAGGWPQLAADVTAIGAGLALAVVAGLLVPVTILSNRLVAARLASVGPLRGVCRWPLELLAYALTATFGAVFTGGLWLVRSGPRGTFAVSSLADLGPVAWGLLLGFCIVLGALCFRLSVGLSRGHGVSLGYAATPVVGLVWASLAGLEDPAGFHWGWVASGVGLVALALWVGRARCAAPDAPTPIRRRASRRGRPGVRSARSALNG